MIRCKEDNPDIISKEGNYGDNGNKDRVINALKEIQHFLRLNNILPDHIRNAQKSNIFHLHQVWFTPPSQPHCAASSE